MNLFLQLIAVVSLQYGSVVVNGQYNLTSSCGGVVTERSSCAFTCETGAASEMSIVWRKGTSVTYDVNYATCTTAASTSIIPSDYVFNCSGTSFTLNIKNASVTRDKTTWKCDAGFGGKESNGITLGVQVTTTAASTTTDNPTSTPEGSKVTVPTTPTPGICKNHLYYLFLLLLVPIIAVVVWCCCCRKNKKQTSHTNTNAMHIGEQIESMSVEVQVNNDNSGQMRL